MITIHWNLFFIQKNFWMEVHIRLSLVLKVNLEPCGLTTFKSTHNILTKLLAELWLLAVIENNLRYSVDLKVVAIENLTHMSKLVNISRFLVNVGDPNLNLADKSKNSWIHYFIFEPFFGLFSFVTTKLSFGSVIYSPVLSWLTGASLLSTFFTDLI